MKTRHTDDSHVLVVSCPAANFADVTDYLKKSGCIVNDTTYYDDEYLSHEQVFPESSPGNRLRGLRYRDEMTQAELSRRVGIPARHISEMENGKRPIGKQNARRFAEAFNIDPRIFLSA